MPRAHRKDFIRSATTTLSPRRSSSHLSCAFTTTSPRASVSLSLCLSLSRSRPHPLFELRSVQPEAPQQIRVVFVPLPVEIPRAISRAWALPGSRESPSLAAASPKNDAGPNADAGAALPAAPAPDGAPHMLYPELPPPSKLSPRPPPNAVLTGVLPAPIPVSATVLIPVPATVPIPIPGDDLPPPPPPPPPPPWYGARG